MDDPVANRHDEAPGPIDTGPAGAGPGEDAGGDAAQNSGVEVLTEAACWELLRTVDIGRLALAGSNGIDIFPVNFVVDHGTIVFRTAPGSKLTLVARNPDAAFEADDVERDRGVAWSVVVKGTASMIELRSDVIDLFDIDLRPWHSSVKPFFVRLEPLAITGRRFAHDG